MNEAVTLRSRMQSSNADAAATPAGSETFDEKKFPLRVRLLLLLVAALASWALFALIGYGLYILVA